MPFVPACSAAQHQNALYGLFQALRNQGREAESRQCLDNWRSLRTAEKARFDAPVPGKHQNQDQRSVADTYFRVALTHLGARRVDEALQHFEAALLFDPSHDLAATNWVNVLRNGAAQTVRQSWDCGWWRRSRTM